MADFSQLTERQKEIYEFIRLKIESRGYGPTVREIGLEFEIKSPNGVMCHLKALEKKGLITREEHAARAIKLVDHRPPAQGLPFMGAVAAGTTIQASEQNERLEVDQMFSGPNRFVLEVHGNSMIDSHIQDGDFVVIHHQEVASNGTRVVAMIDNEATLKRFTKKDFIRLEPTTGVTRSSSIHPVMHAFWCARRRVDKMLLQFASFRTCCFWYCLGSFAVSLGVGWDDWSLSTRASILGWAAPHPRIADLAVGADKHRVDGFRAGYCRTMCSTSLMLVDVFEFLLGGKNAVSSRSQTWIVVTLVKTLRHHGVARSFAAGPAPATGKPKDQARHAIVSCVDCINRRTPLIVNNNMCILRPFLVSCVAQNRDAAIIRWLVARNTN